MYKFRAPNTTLPRIGVVVFQKSSMNLHNYSSVLRKSIRVLELCVFEKIGMTELSDPYFWIWIYLLDTKKFGFKFEFEIFLQDPKKFKFGFGS